MAEQKITEDMFWETYKPKKNHIDDNASFDGCMFETFGEEVKYVVQVANDPKTTKTVWTITHDDGSDGEEKMYYSAGYHLVNRIGYIITEKEYETGIEEVTLPLSVMV
jgi:hypothetical protein